MLYVKIVNNLGKNFLHVASNGCMAVRVECGYQDKHSPANTPCTVWNPWIPWLDYCLLGFSGENKAKLFVINTKLHLQTYLQYTLYQWHYVLFNQATALQNIDINFNVKKKAVIHCLDMLPEQLAMTFCAYPNQSKVKNHRRSITKYCISPKVCAVPHAIMPSISSQDNISFDGFHLLQ